LEKKAEKKKKRLRRLAIWLSLDACFALTIILLILHKPAGYEPIEPNQSASESGHINRYLTYLSSELYNGAQAGQPFAVEVVEDGINQAIAASDWPKASEGILFSAPKVSMHANGITMMCLATVEGVDLVVTVAAVPALLEDGRLNLHIDSVKVGALLITPVAKYTAREIYDRQIGWLFEGTDDLAARVADSLLDDRPFEPVFDIEDKKIRLVDLGFEAGKIQLTFQPESGQDKAL